MPSPGHDSVVAVALRAEVIERILSRSSWPALRSLRVQVDDGVVTLAGDVGRYHEKQAALAEIQRVPGVRSVNDNVKVFYA